MCKVRVSCPLGWSGVAQGPKDGVMHLVDSGTQQPWGRFPPNQVYFSYHVLYPVLCPKLTLIQPTWSAYPYHLVFLIWYPYSLVFLIWYPYAPTSLYGNTAHCSGYGVAMGCLARARPAVPLGLWSITSSLRGNLYVHRLHKFIKWFANNDVAHRN